MPKKVTRQQRDEILRMLSQGHDRDTIAVAVGVTPGQVSAVSAHVRMGTYTLPDPEEQLEEAAPELELTAIILIDRKGPVNAPPRRYFGRWSSGASRFGSAVSEAIRYVRLGSQPRLGAARRGDGLRRRIAMQGLMALMAVPAVVQTIGMACRGIGGYEGVGRNGGVRKTITRRCHPVYASACQFIGMARTSAIPSGSPDRK